MNILDELYGAVDVANSVENVKSVDRHELDYAFGVMQRFLLNHGKTMEGLIARAKSGDGVE